MIDALPRDEVGTPSAFDDAHLSWLTDSISRNRFLPQPDANSIFVGDGDFRAIGAEFLGHFVRTGGLRPHHRVLDVGCGIGRMAVPLTQYLDGERARYEGLDPVEGGIRWCRSTVTPAYPNFAFQRLDIAHELYNPSGKIRGRELKLPFADGQFDFIIMTSVVTHLPADEVMAYLAEIFRVLAQGGRLFMTAFIVDDVARQNATGRRDPRLAFARPARGLVGSCRISRRWQRSASTTDFWKALLLAAVSRWSSNPSATGAHRAAPTIRTFLWASVDGAMHEQANSRGGAQSSGASSGRHGSVRARSLSRLSTGRTRGAVPGCGQPATSRGKAGHELPGHRADRRRNPALGRPFRSLLHESDRSLRFRA